MVEFELSNPVTWVPMTGAFITTILVGSNIIAGYRGSSQKRKSFKLIEGFSMLIRDLRVLAMLALCGLSVWLLWTSSPSSGLDIAKANEAAFWALAALAVLTGLQALGWLTNSILNSAENRKLRQFTNRAKEYDRKVFDRNTVPGLATAPSDVLPSDDSPHLQAMNIADGGSV